MEVFIAFGSHYLEVRSYVGGGTVSEMLKLGAALCQEGLRLAVALGLPPPHEARVASTYLGVTLICEIEYGTTAQDQAIRQFAKNQGWKISRK